MPTDIGQLKAQLVARLGHGHVQPVVVDVEWDGKVGPGEFGGHEGQRRRFGRLALEVGHRHAEEVRQRFGQSPVVQRADVDEHLAQSLATRVGLGLERGGDLTLRHHSA